MHQPVFLVSVLLLATTTSLMAPARAAVVTLGDSLGRDCYLAAALKRETRASIDVCTRALAGDQSSHDRAATLVNRGVVYHDARQYELAVKDYANAIALDPTIGEAHVNYGMALLRIGGHDREAIDALTTGIGLNAPRLEVAYYTRAVANEMIGNVRAAYDDYQTASALKPDWLAPQEQLKRFTIRKKETARG